MKNLPIAGWTLFFALGPSVTLRAQETKTRVVPFEGTQAFAHVLDTFQLKPVGAVADLAELDPAETLIVVFGDTAILEDIGKATGGLREFRKRGGALLIASDRDDHGRLKPWGLRIDGEPVHEILNTAYKQIGDCPFVMPGGDPLLFKGCRLGLATNRPSYIQGQVRLRGLRFLANFSRQCWVQSGVNVQGAPFGVVGSDAGRLLVLAGHGVFMNGMIAQPNCDNWTFAWNCVRWLSGGPGQANRKRALFVEDGQIKTSFRIPLAMPISLPLPTAHLLNRFLRGLEEADVANRYLRRLIPRQQLFRIILILGTLALVVYCARRLGKSRFRSDTRVPHTALEAAPVSQGEPPMEERHHALLRSGNYWEPARTLARFFFEELASPTAKRGGRFRPPTTFPIVQANSGWWHERSLRRQVNFAWNLAYGPTGHLSARALARLVRTLDFLDQEIREGRLILPIH